MQSKLYAIRQIKKDYKSQLAEAEAKGIIIKENIFV